MLSRQSSLPLFSFLFVVSLSTLAIAQIPRTEPERVKTQRPRRVIPRGILTERLSKKDFRKWQAIERLIMAERSDGVPLHPVLRSLWNSVNTSGHAVFIELAQSNRLSTCAAGNFRIETFDPNGHRHTGVIWLNLSNIDQAYIGPSTAYQTGFVPFSDLSREERYVEVLGHELAHALHILSDLERARKVEELIQQTNELLLTTRSRSPSADYELKVQIKRRDAFLRELEAVAEEKEEQVWREIIASRNHRLK